jgi:hypothetical protein
MTKRPSLISGLMTPAAPALGDAPTSPTRGEVVPMPAPAATVKPTPDVIRTSIYLPKPVYRRLKEIALTTDQKVHDLFMEGIDATLRKYGHPGVSELKGGK